MSNKEHLSQLKLRDEYSYSARHKVTTFNLNGDIGLTPYGRERARVCEGGFKGCEGPVTIVILDEGSPGEYKAPRCKSCGTRST